MNNRIAVLTSCYKKDDAEHVKLSIESILNQTFGDVFLFLGVDGPVGGQLGKMLNEYAGKENIKIFFFADNRGLTAVLNDLLAEAKKIEPEYYARMDADDISKPDRFEKQIRYLEDNPEVDVCGGAIEEIDYSGSPNGKIIRYPLTHQQCIDFFATRNPFAHPAVMFRARFFDKVDGYNEKYRKNQDTELWFRALKSGCTFGNLPDVVLSFRISKNMFSRRGGFQFAGEILRLRNQINRELGYGLKAWLFGYAYYVMVISPGCVKKLAYKLFR